MADFTCAVKMGDGAGENMDVGSEPAVVSANNVPGETGDPFKKPAAFAARAVLGRRAAGGGAEGTAGSADRPTPEATATATEASSTTEAVLENDAAPSETAQAPPRFPAKPPPDGKLNCGPPLPYSEPSWGGSAQAPYSLEVLKNGTIVDSVPLVRRSFFVFGRLPVCDVPLEHPSISRYHAVLQYRRRPGGEAGFYAFDLGSTHGTFVNKSRIPARTYIRLRVGYVLRFGGSTRLFILQGPESDEEAESDLTVTELRERARKQREELEKRMMGDGSDDDVEEEGEKESGTSMKSSNEESGCSWGMEEEAVPEEDENAENPFSVEFQEDQEAAYLKDPKKALQGFFDREGEELEYEYEDKGHGTWTCRIKLPVDDALGRQLVAEVTHSGKKKEAAVQCSLEACRMLEARGLLRQEAVSRKRKKKNWEEEDFYDSDDDTFLDRTGMVERKRKERMKRAGKINERPDTYDSLMEKLAEVEKALAETEMKLHSSAKGGAPLSSEDPLDAFMSAVNTQGPLDSVERRKLHVHAAELRREAQRLRRLVELARPAQLPPLQASPGNPSTKQTEAKKLSLPMFGAMKGGSKFKLRTGTIGKVPPKRPSLPAELFVTKELPPGGEEEEEEEEEETQQKNSSDGQEKTPQHTEDVAGESSSLLSRQTQPHVGKGEGGLERLKTVEELAPHKGEEDEQRSYPHAGNSPVSERHDHEKVAPPSSPKAKKKKACGPSRPPVLLSAKYPEDDPDYCVWMPPAGQSGDGRTHLNDKYGY